MGLVYLLRHSPNANVRSGSANSLSKSQYEDALPALIEALADEHAKVQQYACGSLGSHRGELVVPPIIGLLDDPDRSVRHQAIQTLGRLNVRDALPRIRELYSAEEKPGDDANCASQCSTRSWRPSSKTFMKGVSTAT